MTGMEEIKEIFPKKLPLQHWSNPPKVPDTYQVVWHGWHKMCGSYMTWDGEQWLNLDERRKYHKLALSKLHAEMGIFYPGDFFWMPKQEWDIKDGVTNA